ncbi:alpha/beta hydrolase [Helicobacter sp. MIT 14-3879]|uniref:RBBP9/YdeN family alpha/beta hydrolase n=1 Tax=Helicobacter sp. MIT 14-3879 TaxID=2040649 RepID=UPI000E1F7428|nr:YqiA/YcfP family alpha/beta fold hydrolase [Helicobacter sp. MIT 14-3879]RDU65109.1 serine hydrolase family protein [Helicobacter sp. MIT 14-3879]
MRRIYLIHGFESSPNKHWFKWLKNTALNDNIEVTILEMPNSSNPKLSSWIEKMQNDIKSLDSEVYLIGHSLGGISILRFIETISVDSNIGGFILVSGFCEPLPELPILDEFTKEKLNVDKIKKIAKNRVIIAAKDDYIVPYYMSENLAKKIDAKFILLEKGGHFMQEDGVLELPILYNLIKN